MIHNILVQWLRLGRPTRLIVAVGTWAAIASLALVTIGQNDRQTTASTPGETVYSVPQVLAGIHRRPAAWIGRTLVIRGFFETSCCTGSMPNPGFPVNGLFAGPSPVLIPAPPSLPLQGEGRRLSLAPDSWATVRVTLIWQAKCDITEGALLGPQGYVGGIHGCVVGRLDP